MSSIDPLTQRGVHKRTKGPGPSVPVWQTEAAAVRSPLAQTPARSIVPRPWRRDPSGMSITPKMSQRDLVKLSLLVCGERTGAKYRPPVKGTDSTSR